MKKILIYGNNSVSNFLLSGLNYFDYETLDITNSSDISEHFNGDTVIDCIIDASNAIETIEEDQIFFHNDEGIIELLHYSNRYKIPFLFVYKEPLTIDRTSSLTYAIENIDKLKKPTSMFVKVQIEDIYGPDLNTSQKIEDYLTSLASNQSINVESDLTEFYLMHQKDLFSGIIAAMRDVKATKTQRFFTLFPEEPITEIELAHLVTELTDLSVEIEYLSEDINRRNLEVDIDTMYPINWMPKTSIDKGIVELFKYYGIPLKENKSVQESNQVDIGTVDDTNEMDETPPSTISIEINPEPVDEEPQIEQSDSIDPIDPLGLLETNSVDNISTEIETGTRYYRPARTVESHKKETSKSTRKLKKNITVGIALSSLLVLSSLSSVAYISRYKQVVNLIDDSNSLFENQRYEESAETADKALSQSNGLYNPPFLINLYSQQLGLGDKQIYEATKNLSTVAELQKNLAFTYKSINSINPSGTNVSISDNSVLGANTSDSTNIYIDKLKELLSSSPRNNTDYILYTDELNNISSDVIQNSEFITKVDTTLLRKVFGFSSKQKYLFVTQDISNIKATGGAIRKFGHLDFEIGKITFAEQKDIKEFDDSIKLTSSSFIAPNEIKVIKGVDFMPASEINWDVDFNKNAENLLSVYKSTYGNTAFDGVIAIDQKIYDELSSNSLSSDIDKLNKVISGLNSRHIYLYHTDGPIKGYLLENKWTGSIEPFEDDYLYVVDTNLSEENTNDKITRSIEYKFSPLENENTFARELIIKYKNDNTEGTGYINHLRIVVPNNILLNSGSLSINNSEKTSITRSIKMLPAGKYNVISTDVLVPNGTEIALFIEYESPYKSLEDKKINLFVQKQPGQINEKLVITGIYPAQGRNSIIWEGLADNDINVEIPL